MKTITQIKQHFSDNEIKICVDIINGKLDFSVLDDQIKDFYSDEYNEEDLTGKEKELLMVFTIYSFYFNFFS